MDWKFEYQHSLNNHLLIVYCTCVVHVKASTLFLLVGGLCIVLVNWIIHYTTTCHIIIFFSVSIVCCIYINIIVILWPCPNLKDYLFKELIYFDLTKNVQQNINFLQYYGSTIYTWLKNLSSSSLYIHMTL